MYFPVFIYIRTTKTNYFEKDKFRLTPALFAPPVKLKDLEPTKKNLFVLSKITNNWLGKKRTIGCLLFPFLFKNELRFIYCAEQNAKCINSLRRSSPKNMKRHSQMVRF